MNPIAPGNSEQEKAKYLECILHSSIDIAFVTTDLELRITYFNPAAKNLFYTKADNSIVGSNIFEATGLEQTDTDRIKNAITSLKQKQSQRLEIRQTHAGRQRYLECNLSQLCGRDNKIIGYTFSSRDITNQKQEETQLGTYLNYLESIEQINQIIGKAKDIQQLMKSFVDCMLTIFGCDRAWLLYPCNPNAKYWRVPIESTHPRYPGAHAAKLDIPQSEDSAQVFQTALDANGPVTYHPGTLPVPESAKAFDVRSQIDLAIHPRLGDPWLLGMHQCSHERIWSNDDQRLFQDIGHRLSDAISNLLYHQHLHSAQQDWEESLNAVPDHICICNQKGTILRSNRAMHDYFEDTHSNLIGLNYRLVYYGSESCGNRCPCSTTLSNGEPMQAEIQFPNMGGWQQVSAYPRFNITKEQIGAIFVVRDITINKVNEAALKESKERYQTLVETMSEGLGVQDANGTIQYVNNRLCSMLGYQRDEFIGRSIRHFLGTSNIRDWESLMNQRRQGEIEPYEAEITHHNGQKINLRISPQIIRDSAGNFSGSFAIFTDLTEQKRSQERLRKLSQAVEQSPNPIIIIDKSGIIEYANPALIKETGYSLHEVVGNRLSLLESADGEPDLYDDLWRTVSAGRTWTGETTIRNKDGTLRLHYLVVTPIKDTDNNITHYVSIHTDITQYREAEKKVRQHQNTLAHVTRVGMLGEMASGLAHELNQPLTAIASYSDTGLSLLHKSEFQHDKLKHILEQTHTQACWAGKIIQRIRRMAKKEPSQTLDQNINPVIKEACSLIKFELQSRDIALHYRLAQSLPDICIDSIQIEQVILNLIQNAVEAIEKHGTLTISSQLTADNQVKVGIADSGIGLAEEIFDNLFVPFFSTKENGLGVGLSLSRSIIESHGGRLWADKHNESNGAKFYFTLPTGSS
jgi:PAS domain S-box-containing protein